MTSLTRPARPRSSTGSQAGSCSDIRFTNRKIIPVACGFILSMPNVKGKSLLLEWAFRGNSNLSIGSRIDPLCLAWSLLAALGDLALFRL